MCDNLKIKGRNAETARKETSFGHSLAALDQLSATFHDDMERAADLLGKSCLRYSDIRVRVVRFFS